MGEEQEKYSVVQFFLDGQYEYVRRNVPAEEAAKAADFYTTNVMSRIGLTKRVIVVDQGDCICWEWTKENGVVFPPQQIIH